MFVSTVGCVKGVFSGLEKYPDEFIILFFSFLFVDILLNKIEQNLRTCRFPRNYINIYIHPFQQLTCYQICVHTRAATLVVDLVRS